MLYDQSLNKQQIAFEYKMLFFERKKKMALDRNYLKHWLIMLAGCRHSTFIKLFKTYLNCRARTIKSRKLLEIAFRTKVVFRMKYCKNMGGDRTVNFRLKNKLRQVFTFFGHCALPPQFCDRRTIYARDKEVQGKQVLSQFVSFLKPKKSAAIV